MAESDEALIARAYRYACALTGDPVHAEDLLQDAWSAVLQAGGPHTAPYLFRAVRSRWLDERRRARVVTFEPFGTEQFPDGAPGPTGDARRVLAALGGLRDEEREALFLCAVEGWTAQEVSDRTGQPRGTILSLVHRGRARLRTLLGIEEEEEEDRAGRPAKGVAP